MSSKVYLDRITKQEAIEFANREADLNGFKRNGEEWKASLREYLGFAYGTMSLGRNPRAGMFKYSLLTELYPDVFSSSGFAGKVREKFKARAGEGSLSLESIQNRLLAAVSNLAKLFENGVMGIKTTTESRAQGKIENKEMSDVQLPNKEEFETKEEFDQAVATVVKNWFVSDLITDAILESLQPFFTMSSKDVEEIMNAVEIKEGNLKELANAGRKEFVRKLRSQVREKFKEISYKKFVLGE